MLRSNRTPRVLVPHLVRFRAVLSFCCLAVLSLPIAAQRPLKVYISADMEGIAGIVSDNSLGPSGFDYPNARELMTGEVLAAIDGARDAGATAIVVSDSHGNGENILIAKLPADVTLVRGWPRPLMMMQGIDSTFDAAVFIGYHASTTNPAGVRAHTISSATFSSVKLNGIAVPEAGINAAIAGQFGIPIVAVSGDNVAVAEMQALLGAVEGAAVKQAISFHAAASLTPAASQKLIREKVKAGIARRRDFKPYAIKTPVQLDISLKSYRPAELLAYLPIVQRIDSHTIRYTGQTMTEVSKFIEFITNYEPGLLP